MGASAGASVPALLPSKLVERPGNFGTCSVKELACPATVTMYPFGEGGIEDLLLTRLGEGELTLGTANRST